jgi:hypothetical protein
MFSGKTELLQTFVRRYTIAEKNVIVLVPEWDNRFKKGLILSHAGRELTNTLIVPVKTDDSKQWMSASVNADVIVFEEAQFFSGDIALDRLPNWKVIGMDYNGDGKIDKTITVRGTPPVTAFQNDWLTTSLARAREYESLRQDALRTSMPGKVPSAR